MIDEADKLLDYHFNQWLPKLLAMVSHDKATPKGCGYGKTSLEETMQNLCLHPEKFRLMVSRKDRDRSEVVRNAKYTLTRVLEKHMNPPPPPPQMTMHPAGLVGTQQVMGSKGQT